MKRRFDFEDPQISALKQEIGFGMAFKATLGFYCAQFVATLLGLAVLASVGVFTYLIVTR